MSKDNVEKAQQLKPEDTNLLVYTRTHLDAIFSGLLSTIASGKLGYKVTERTQFKLSDDFSHITISEAKDDNAIRKAEEKTDS